MATEQVGVQFSQCLRFSDTFFCASTLLDGNNRTGQLLRWLQVPKIQQKQR